MSQHQSRGVCSHTGRLHPTRSVAFFCCCCCCCLRVIVRLDVVSGFCIKPTSLLLVVLSWVQVPQSFSCSLVLSFLPCLLSVLFLICPSVCFVFSRGAEGRGSRVRSRVLGSFRRDGFIAQRYSCAGQTGIASPVIAAFGVGLFASFCTHPSELLPDFFVQRRHGTFPRYEIELLFSKRELWVFVQNENENKTGEERWGEREREKGRCGWLDANAAVYTESRMDRTGVLSLSLSLSVCVRL